MQCKKSASVQKHQIMTCERLILSIDIDKNSINRGKTTGNNMMKPKKKINISLIKFKQLNEFFMFYCVTETTSGDLHGIR